MISAAFSAVAYTELTMFPLTLLGKTLASATRNPLTPFTRSRLSRALPMAQVPIGWYSERTQSLFPHVSAGLQGDAWQLTELPLWIAQCLGGRLQEQGIVDHSQSGSEYCHVCRMPEVAWVDGRVLCRICHAINLGLLGASLEQIIEVYCN